MCCPPACSRSSRQCSRSFQRLKPLGVVVRSAKRSRLRRRRRHQGVPGSAHSRGGLCPDPQRPAGARPARESRLPQRRGHPRLRARRRPGARARRRPTASAPTIRACRSDSPRCSSASTRVRRHGTGRAPDRRSPGARIDAQGQALQGRTRARRSGCSINWSPRQSWTRPRNGCSSSRPRKGRHRSSRSS